MQLWQLSSDYCKSEVSLREKVNIIRCIASLLRCVYICKPLFCDYFDNQNYPMLRHLEKFNLVFLNFNRVLYEKTLVSCTKVPVIILILGPLSPTTDGLARRKPLFGFPMSWNRVKKTGVVTFLRWSNIANCISVYDLSCQHIWL